MCTNFLLAVPADPGNASPKMYVSARCLELAGSLPTSIYLIPCSQNFPLVSFPGVENPVTWTNQYGFVAVADPFKFSTFPCFMDGMNEKGLSFGALWLPGTDYPSSGSNPNLYFSDFGAWILGNFDTVAKLESELPKISIVGPPIPTKERKSPNYVPLHFIATDYTGASLVVEFVDGEMNVYPPSYAQGATSDGVLTNAPTYDWQRANLANYSNLTVVGTGTSIGASDGPPVGSGLLGMPGDSMSASRFVKAATLRQGFGLLPKDGTGWLPTAPADGATGSVQTIVNVAMQMVQVIQTTPYGTALTAPATPSSPPQVGDWTMWSVVRDHTNLVYYFTTAFNGIMRAVDLNTVNFGTPTADLETQSFQSIALLPAPTTFAWYEDVSTQFA